MNHFKRQLVLAATQAAVYQAIATEQGLRDWWTHSCDAAPNVGGLINFRFGNTHKTMRIDSLLPGSEVRWHCVQANIEIPGVKNKAEWVGTDIVFKLTPLAGGKTQLDFEHVGLTPAFECFTQCEGGWTMFLGSLKQLVETGTGAPYIDNVAEVCSH
ncbi:MAG: SRPBCC domain-containing protein [Pseudomonadota bacterium]